MSLTEMIEELPKLSLAERRELEIQLIGLEPNHEELEVCDFLSLEAVQVLDRMEQEDARESQES